MPTKAAKTRPAKPKSGKNLPPRLAFSGKPVSDPRFRIGRSVTGLGLFARQDIGKGEFIIEYDGPRISNAEVEAIVSHRYLFEVNNRWTIDGSPRWNTARYVNHSCRANSEPIERAGRIRITAKKRIRPGDEITYNYGRAYFNELIKPMGCKCAHCQPRLHRKAG